MLIGLVILSALVFLGICVGIVLIIVMKNRSPKQETVGTVFPREEDPVTQIVIPPSDGRVPIVRALTFTVVEGPQIERTFSVKGVVASIGRDGTDQVKLTDPTVSRSSAKVSLTRDGWVLINDEALNPVLVDEEVVPKKSATPPKDGSIIQIGKTKLLFRPIEYKVA
ncbi:FHA domain-containing protein [Candidatus Poribacteria bacterium]|nr:FHA domain-containing protein [Candidatus Poribacteria bacterium]